MQDESAKPDRSTITLVILLIALVAVGIFVATRTEDEVGMPKTAFEVGKRMYRSICIACHHPDPSKQYGTAAAFGPPIAGSTLELLEMRVLSTSYPKGYKPKRNTQLMTTFKMTDAQLAGLHTYVNHPDAGKPDAPGDDDEDEDGDADADAVVPKKGK